MGLLRSRGPGVSLPARRNFGLEVTRAVERRRAARHERRLKWLLLITALFLAFLIGVSVGYGLTGKVLAASPAAEGVGADPDSASVKD
jgi:hypothetical protein